MKYLQTPTGIPVLLTDDGAVTLTDEHQSFVVAQAMDDPAVLDDLERLVREGIERITGLDSTLPDADWHMHFQMILTINQFVPALRVIGNARHSLREMSHE